jgi:cobalt/nickel transport system permease protein
MNIERYSNRNSIIHNWDPRARIVSLALLIISIATLKSPAMAAIGLALSLTILAISLLSWRQIAVNLRWPVLFLSLFLLILPLTVDGRSIASFSILSVSCEGVSLGLSIFLKGLAAVILAQVLLASCPFSVTALAMKDLGVPNSLVQIFLFTYRYIDLLAQELTNTFRSLSARGFERRSDIRTAKVYGNALGALLISSILRSERIFYSMVSRCYSGQIATSREWRMNLQDWTKCAIVLAIALALHFAEILA